MALSDEDLRQLEQHLAASIETTAREQIKAQREEFEASLKATQERFAKQVEHSGRHLGLYARSVEAVERTAVAEEKKAAALERIAAVLERVEKDERLTECG